MKNHYIKYPLDYKQLFKILSDLNKKRVNFFVDIQSIATGFYNKNNIFMEINHYVDHNRTVSNVLIQELREFLNTLYRRFKKYDPYFVLFYDDGYCQQNRAIYSNYKHGRSNIKTVLMHDEQVELYRQIKKYYFDLIEERFTKPDISKVFYLRQYEADFVPHYCILKGLYDGQDSDVLNIILSSDKDLLQTCKFQNTIQCTVTYHSSKEGKDRVPCRIFDNLTALNYIHQKIKRGVLTAEYIPMLLSIAGDVSDQIPGIKNIGPIKAFEQIVNWNIPPSIDKLRPVIGQMSTLIQDHFDLITRNFKLIDFEKQIERVSVLNKIF